MKSLTAAILSTMWFAVFNLAPTEGADTVQVRIQVSLKNVDETWFSGQLTKNKQLRDLPTVATRLGQAAVIQVLREYRAPRHDSSDSLIRCGAELSLTPRIVEGKIRISGTSVLRRPVKDGIPGTPNRFEAQENLIDLQVENGERREVHLREGGLLIISATLLDVTGTPLTE